MRTTVRLDDELLRRAKIHAAEQGTTLTALIEAGLRHVLDGGQMGGAALGVREEQAAFQGGVENMQSQSRRFVESLPVDHGPALLSDPEYLRLAEKAGSTLPSRILAVLDEEDDLEKVKRPDSTAR